MLSCSNLRLVGAIHLSIGTPWWVKPSQGHGQTYGNIAHREIVLGFDVSSHSFINIVASINITALVLRLLLSPLLSLLLLLLFLQEREAGKRAGIIISVEVPCEALCIKGSLPSASLQTMAHTMNITARDFCGLESRQYLKESIFAVPGSDN